MSGLSRKYQLAICEFFNPYFHGYDIHSDPTIKSQFLVFELIDLQDFYNNQYKESSDFLASIYSSMILEIINNHSTNNGHHENITDITDIIPSGWLAVMPLDIQRCHPQTPLPPLACPSLDPATPERLCHVPAHPCHGA